MPKYSPFVISLSAVLRAHFISPPPGGWQHAEPAKQAASAG